MESVLVVQVVGVVPMMLAAVAVMEHKSPLCWFVPAGVLVAGSCCPVVCALVELPLHVL